MTLAPGTSLASCRILDLLGAGATGEVYRATEIVAVLNGFEELKRKAPPR